MQRITIRQRIKAIFPFLGTVTAWARTIKKNKKPEKVVSAPPVGPDGIRIICYEDVDAWILGKFAKKMNSWLHAFGRKSNIAKTGDPTAAVCHHIIYFDAERKWAPVETFMITHLDQPWKIDKVRRQLELYDMGICMSEETCVTLRNLGMPADRLCYINPAHDGVIRPRPVVLGIASKVHDDGRKNEEAIVNVMKQFPPGTFQLKIMGMGWQTQVADLNNAGYQVEYFDTFDYKAYTTSFMPSLDYFIYFSHDEGSMAYVDAIAAGVKTIVTPQGYHLDVEEGIDHAIDDPADLVGILQEIADERVARHNKVSSWTWKEYTWRHLVLWDFLLEKTSPVIASERQAFFAARGAGLSDVERLRHELESPVPSCEALLEAVQSAVAMGLNRLSACYARQGLVFHPKNAAFKQIVLEYYLQTGAEND